MSRRSRDRKRRGRKAEGQQQRPQDAASPPPAAGTPEPARPAEGGPTPPAGGGSAPTVRPQESGPPPPPPPPRAADGAAVKGPVPVREALGKVPADTAPSTDARPPEAAPQRGFEMEGERWIARVAGAGAAGTGPTGSAYLVAVHFVREEDPERPVREALLPRGRFEGLFDEELLALYGRAVEVVIPDEV